MCHCVIAEIDTSAKNYNIMSSVQLEKFVKGLTGRSSILCFSHVKGYDMAGESLKKIESRQGRDILKTLELVLE